jgi:integral membrane protein
MGSLLLISSIRVLKFLSLLAFAGAVGIALWGSALPQRKRAVHMLASPCLLLVWLAGYALALHLRVPLTEAWILLGFLCSFFAQIVLARTTRQAEVAAPLRFATLGLLALTVVFMVLRPTWSLLLGGL